MSLLLTGHSHFDHSFDTGVWSELTRAKITGSKTTSLQIQAERIPADRCTTVSGGERMTLGVGVTMYVVRFNHSGDPAKNPEQHNPVELDAVPRPDSTGGLRAGLAEDFPNGGGNRAFSFVVDGADGPFSWFFNNSASAVDLDVPILVDAGLAKPYADSALERYLAASNVRLIRPVQYMDKWRLARTGVRPVGNVAVKRAFGF